MLPNYSTYYCLDHVCHVCFAIREKQKLRNKNFKLVWQIKFCSSNRIKTTLHTRRDQLIIRIIRSSLLPFWQCPTSCSVKSFQISGTVTCLNKLNVHLIIYSGILLYLISFLAISHLIFTISIVSSWIPSLMISVERFHNVRSRVRVNIWENLLYSQCSGVSGIW